jgi:hypothetical protein
MASNDRCPPVHVEGRSSETMSCVNRWMDRLSIWQFALVWASALGAGFVIVGCISLWAIGRLKLSFLLGYGAVYIAGTTTAATWDRQRRLRRIAERAAGPAGRGLVAVRPAPAKAVRRIPGLPGLSRRGRAYFGGPPGSRGSGGIPGPRSDVRVAVFADPGQRIKPAHFGVTLDESRGSAEYNYRSRAEFEAKGEDFFSSAQPFEMPGQSCFLQADGRVFHTYSQYARGLECTGGSYYFLDLTALGRQEEWEEPTGRSASVRSNMPDFSA